MREVDFTEAISLSVPPEKGDRRAWTFFSKVFLSQDKEELKKERMGMFSSYLRPLFPSIGFSPFSKEERKGMVKGSRAEKSYFAFSAFVASSYQDIPSLFLSIRYRISYLFLP